MPSANQCPALKEKNTIGLKQAHKRGAYDNWNLIRKQNGISWNKGKTAKDDPRIAKAANLLREGYATGRLKGSFTGRKETLEHRKAISESMKKAHKEGRAHNIGECRWNNEHSWPEKWFIEVIANEFEDKDYQCELPFHRFALDFAWLKKKKCIEIDGNYHEREDQRKRDFEKDKLLKKEGWQILRMPWKEVFADPKFWIQKAKDFIDSTIIAEYSSG